MSKVLKVLAVIGLASILITIAVIVSFVSSCSDSPTHDSRDVRSFIEDRKVTERDLATFDALRGCIENMHDTLALNIARNGDDGTGEETHRQLMTVDELRQSLQSGTWPGKKSGFGTTDSPHNPQLWVRLAELSEDQIETAMGENWEIVDFAYPFPHGGSVPAPATRGENDVVRTLLVCRSGTDTGLYATVRYWRWANPARFEIGVDEARAEQEAREHAYHALDGVSALAGRRFLYDGSNVVIWELETDDPLRDPEAFTQAAGDVVNALDGSATISLVRHDTPVAIGWEGYSADYPNDHDTELLSFEEGRETLLHSGYRRVLDQAPEDVLLSAHCSKNAGSNAVGLHGALASDDWSQDGVRWDKPSYGCLFDADLEKIARAQLGYGAEKPMIAVSTLVSRGDASENTDLYAWVIVPRGAFPEAPDAFCSAVDGIRDELWDVAVGSPEGEQQRNLYLQVVVVDGESIAKTAGEGTIPSTFDELARSLHEDMGSMDQYELEVMLEGEASLRQWHEQWRLNRFDCEPGDVKGALASTREWHYGS